jgi:hypothetical protein
MRTRESVELLKLLPPGAGLSDRSVGRDKWRRCVSPTPLSKTLKESVSTLIFMALLSSFLYIIAGRGIGTAAGQTRLSEYPK